MLRAVQKSLKPLQTLRSLALTLAVSCLLAACSHIGLAYRNLDVIIPWTLSDYLSMTREQKALFGERLEENLRWHCTTQLPLYLTWLDQLRAMAVSGQASDAQLQALSDAAKQAISAIATEITPSTVEILQGLDDDQVADLQASLAKDMQERRDKFLTPPLQQQIADHAERMEKRLTPWLGSLNDAQKQRIGAWALELSDNYRDWLDNRAHWQAQFIAAIEQRHAPDFPQRMQTLLQGRESLWTPHYREVYTHSEQATRSLLVDLLKASDADQRKQLVSKIDQLHKELAGQDCLKAVNAGVRAVQ